MADPSMCLPFKKPLGEGAPITLTLDDMETRAAFWAMRSAAAELNTCEHVFRFLAAITGDGFAWDEDGYAITGILDFAARALAVNLHEQSVGGDGLWGDLMSLAERLKELKEAADADL